MTGSDFLGKTIISLVFWGKGQKLPNMMFWILFDLCLKCKAETYCRDIFETSKPMARKQLTS